MNLRLTTLEAVQYGGVSKGIRRAYLTDVSDEEWAFVLPYLLLSRVDNASRQHDLRALFDAVRYIVKTGNQWRLMPHDLPRWPAAYQQMQRWLNRPKMAGLSLNQTAGGIQRLPGDRRCDVGSRTSTHRTRPYSSGTSSCSVARRRWPNSWTQD